MTGGVLLSFEDVGCRRGGRVLFEHLSFSIGAGPALLLTGPNGASKSSLIRMAAGLLAPTATRTAPEDSTGLLAHHLALAEPHSLLSTQGLVRRPPAAAPEGVTG